MIELNRLGLPLASLLGFASLLGLASVGFATSALAANSCSVQSTAVAPAVVELYTSEGCNSCPPANQWLSKVKADPSVVSLAFHVDYWDHLGWKDRFSKAGFTERQSDQRAVNGAPFSATPQVVINGVYKPSWSRATVEPQSGKTAPVEVTLAEDAGHYDASITPVAGATAKLAAYWAVTQDDFTTAVEAGENSGVALHEDSVVRQFQEVPAWTPKVGTATHLQFKSIVANDLAHPHHVNLVIVDAETGKPVQAVKLGC